MIEMMTKFMLAGTLVMLCAPVAQCKCQPFSFKLDSSRLDPCGSFTVTGNGCFQSGLEEELAVETYKWVIYQRYKQVFSEARASNAYGGKCSSLYESTCPGKVNSVSNCEPLCKWFQSVVKQETFSSGCHCASECKGVGLSATPLKHLTAGAVTLRLSTSNVLQRILVTVPTDLAPSPNEVEALQKQLGTAAKLNYTHVLLSIGSRADTSVCEYMQVDNHPYNGYNGRWTLGSSWSNQPHYTKTGTAGETLHLYFFDGWGGSWNFDDRDQLDYTRFRLERAGMWNWNAGGYISESLTVTGPPRSVSQPLYKPGDLDFYTTYGHTKECKAKKLESPCELPSSGPAGLSLGGFEQIGTISIVCAPTPSCECSGDVWPMTVTRDIYQISIDYGGYCQAWDDGNCKLHGCGTKSLCDDMWPTYNPGTWCCQPWCYVNNETCSLSDVAGSVLEGAGGMKLYYSYMACTGTGVKYTDSTCPWSKAVSFGAGSSPFAVTAEHAFCDIGEAYPFTGYKGTLSSELGEALGVEEGFVKVKTMIACRSMKRPGQSAVCITGEISGTAEHLNGMSAPEAVTLLEFQMAANKSNLTSGVAVTENFKWAKFVAPQLEDQACTWHTPQTWRGCAACCQLLDATLAAGCLYTDEERSRKVASFNAEGMCSTSLHCWTSGAVRGGLSGHSILLNVGLFWVIYRALLG